MTPPEKIIHNGFTIYVCDGPADPHTVMEQMSQGEIIRDKGRGGIRVLSVDGRKMACRQYIHGGLFRAITGDRFCSEKRALDEAGVLCYLAENSFPVVRPCCVIAERAGIAKRLYLITEFVQDASDLLDIWRTASRMRRFRIVKRLAVLFRRLEMLGVYHPDLHINNVLLTGQGELVFLDFDRARKKTVTADDMEKMFRRLDRYMEKQKRRGDITLDMREKIFFLRVYQKLSGCDILSRMEKQLKTRTFLNRIGWFVESLLYGGNR
ncbi:MAG: 3-deoxy-D-manno-octulosonic acid kinase [Syntrophorhabdus sp. PtaU1.Bin058]|nr:MAG: 3-deoxy-D-manno-octulosonic acid kinase [Syntrophorhabdus sp. PtaU1.Bin058]